MTNNGAGQTLLISFLLFFTCTSYSQEAILPVGGDIAGSTGSVSYSVGQVMYTIQSDSTGSVTQGVQQPYEIFNMGINDSFPELQIMVFPNPTADNFIVQIVDHCNEQRYLYHLVNLEGRMITSGEIVSSHTIIQSGILPPSIYILHIITEGMRPVTTFKIIKY